MKDANKDLELGNTFVKAWARKGACQLARLTLLGIQQEILCLKILALIYTVEALTPPSLLGLEG